MAQPISQFNNSEYYQQNHNLVAKNHSVTKQEMSVGTMTTDVRKQIM